MAGDLPDRFVVEEEFLFIGRTFTEYRRMFDLDVTELVGNSVLDCGGGPSSFTAVAPGVGVESVAIDPAYGPPPEALESECEQAIERTLTQLQEKRDAFVWDEYGTVDGRGRYLRAAAEQFLADYAQTPGRYVTGGLPTLPFETDSFALALCANLLFLYDDRLGREFHLESIRELARVAREVRLFPLSSLDREQSGYVTPVVDVLQSEGHDVQLRDVPYEFQPGATEMLVVSTW